MSKKHRNPPQRRGPTRPTAQAFTGELPQNTNIVSPEPSIERLSTLLGAGNDRSARDPIELIMKRRDTSDIPSDVDEETRFRASMLAAAEVVIDAYDLLYNRGIDLADENGDWNTWSMQLKCRQAARMFDIDTEVLTEHEQMTYGQAYKLYMAVVMANKRLTQGFIDSLRSNQSQFEEAAIKAGVRDGRELADVQVGDEIGLYRNLVDNPSRMKRRTQEHISEITSPQFRQFIEEEAQRLYEKFSLSLGSGEAVGLNLFGGQKLDYEILPEGTTLRERTEELCSRLTPSEVEHIDLRRIKLLSKIKECFGEDRTYFVHGKPRGSIVDPRGESINEAYLGVVVQHHDESGNVAGEDCVVISPIARRHAAFVVRHDVSEKGWRDVLKTPKRTSRQFGARQVKFTVPDGVDVYDGMLQKLQLLLVCPSDRFSQGNELRYNASTGEFTLRPPRERPLGNIALKGA